MATMCRARKACDCDSVDDEALLLLGLWLRMDRVARGLDSTVLRVGTLSRMSCCHQTSASHQSERAVVCRAFAKARGPRRHAGNRRESRLPKHARVSFSSSHNINTPLPSTALPPSPSTTHPHSFITTFLSSAAAYSARPPTYLLHGTLLPPNQRHRQHALTRRRHRHWPHRQPGRRSGWYLCPPLSPTLTASC